MRRSIETAATPGSAGNVDRRRANRSSLVLAVAVSAAVSYGGSWSQSPPTQTASHFPSTAAEFDQMFKQVSNWGRWGRGDELGAANLVTPEKRRAAIGLVKRGISVSLSHNPITDAAADVPAPFELTPTPPRFISDTIKVTYHGYSHSHIDALCHFSYKDQTYNGYPRAEINTDKGCMKLDIQRLKNGIVTRGVLVDIPRLRGVEYLEPSTAIYPDEVVAWEKRTGLRVLPGDAIFLRTGRWARRQRLGPWKITGVAAGFHASVVPLLWARDIAFFGSDAVGDVEPTYIEGYTGSGPVHTAIIAAMGVNILDNQDLEALAATAARFNRWEFMVSFAPLAITRGTGSPVNVTATF